MGPDMNIFRRFSQRFESFIHPSPEHMTPSQQRMKEWYLYILLQILIYRLVFKGRLQKSRNPIFESNQCQNQIKRDSIPRKEYKSLVKLDTGVTSNSLGTHCQQVQDLISNIFLFLPDDPSWSEAPLTAHAFI